MVAKGQGVGLSRSNHAATSVIAIKGLLLSLRLICAD
jgi:hypothetical protein